MVKKSIIKTYIQIVLISLLLIGCSPQERLNRLISNNPQLVQQDTIIVRDTVVVENYNYDTTTIIKLYDTTTVINNERVVLKYYYDTLREVIYHEVECLGDTVYTEKLITVEKAVFRELSWWEKYKELIFIGLILIFVLMILKKIGKIL
tara:strand:+ start:3565 stop:4011 length:447 start_codon:yes stop_codon:yes gene_type:complete